MTEMVKYQELGLSINRQLSWDEADAVQYVLTRYTKNLSWYWGDYLNYIEKVWPETYTQLIPEDIGNSKTLANWKWVANRIPMSGRRKELSFSHHAEVAKYDPELRDEYLDMAIEGQWTITQMREEVRGKTKKRTKKCPQCGHVWA